MSSHSNQDTNGGRATGPLGTNQLFEEYEPIIKQILSVLNVTRDIREDCYQAACLGLLKAEKKQHKVKFFKSYAVRCMKNEILKEIANLKGCGQAVFALDKITFLLLFKYKKALQNGSVPELVSELQLSDGRVKDLDKLHKVKRFDYAEYFLMDDK